jgi:hypothetical protein
MDQTVRIADYFYIEVPEKAGEGARALAQLRDAGVNLLAFSGFPAGRRAQLDFIPDNPAAFRAAAKKAGVKLTGPKKVFLIQGEDRMGVMADLLGRLAAAKISVISSQAICAGAGRFGGLLWVAPRDVRRAAKALDAK